MSGICGVFYLDGRPAHLIELEDFGQRLAHRGGDSFGCWMGGSIGLWQHTLWTTPEALREAAPLIFREAASEVVLVYDGRIDNRDDLIAPLGLHNLPEAEIPDGMLIGEAYRKWGETCTEKLLGDFAYAIWDGRQQCLFCARDHIGTKPFYYYYAPGKFFIFASEPKAFFRIPGITRRLNEIRVAEHILRITEDPASTFFQGIYRLPAAHRLVVSSRGMQLQRYWTLDPKRELRLRSDEEYGEAFREVFTGAVKCRLRSAFPAGSTLSGGLDSSSIACTARNLIQENGKQPLDTFSAIFPDLPEEELKRIDERSYVQDVLEQGGYRAHFIHADRLNPLEILPEAFWHLDEPLPGPNLYLHWAIYEAAQQNGVRVLLDGIDGDTTVSHGYERFPSLARSFQWIALYREVKAYSYHYRIQTKPSRLIWRLAFRPLVPIPIMNLLWSRRRAPVPTLLETSAINPEFARQNELQNRFQALRKSPSLLTISSREAHWEDLNSPLIPLVLELADKPAAKHSIEARYPFFDRRLIELCLSLPVRQKFYNGWPRMVLRQGMEGILPEAVRWRAQKSDLSPNYRRKMLEYGRETLDRVLLHHPDAIREYYDLSAIQGAYRRLLDWQADEIDALNIFNAASLAIWLEVSETKKS